ncbi:hypothetical protein [Methanobrevibacter sp.]
MEAQDLVFGLIAFILAIIIFYLFIWLLPVAIILLITFFIYMIIKNMYGDKL